MSNNTQEGITLPTRHEEKRVVKRLGETFRLPTSIAAR